MLGNSFLLPQNVSVGPKTKKKEVHLGASSAHHLSTATLELDFDKKCG